MRTSSSAGKLEQLLIGIRSSLWFVPTLVVAGAVALALGLIEIDLRAGEHLRDRWPRLFAVEAEGSRAILSTIAGSMITVAGVVFSITIVALTLASSQYTSRVLRNFMRDSATQVVLGVFVGIYAYCLLVLRTVSSGDGTFVPSLAMLGAVLLALVGIAFLIFFIHHIAASIQAGEIIAGITRDTTKAVDRLFPQELGDEAEDAAGPADSLADLAWYGVPALATGYVQSVDAEALLAFARERGAVLRMEAGVGDFVTQGRPIASLALGRVPDAATVRALNRLYAVGSYRTTDQDVAFGIRQLVDVALKALSPGINDTTTAVTCIDYAAVILSRCASRRFESPYRFEHGELRVVARGPTFERLAALAFDQIVENAEGNTAILVRLLTAVEQVAEVARTPQRRRVLMRHVQVVAEVADRSVKSSYARSIVEEHVARVRSVQGVETALPLSRTGSASKA